MASGASLKMLDVIVGIEGGEPHDAAVTALHAPHPVDGIGIDSTGRRIEDDPAEHLQASDVLAREPGAVGRGQDVVLKDEGLEPAIFIEDRDLLIVERPPENVGRGVDMGIHEAIGLTAGGGGGKTRTCANTSPGSTTVAMPAPPTIAIPPLRNARRLVWAHCVCSLWAQPTWIAPGMAAARSCR